MEGQFEDAESRSSGCAASSGSEGEGDSDWSDEDDYGPDLDDYNWERETGDFTKKLASLRAGTQPNSNKQSRCQTKAATSNTFTVNDRHKL